MCRHVCAPARKVAGTHKMHCIHRQRMDIVRCASALAVHQLEALLHIQSTHFLETGVCEKRFLTTLLARHLATLPHMSKLMVVVHWGGVSGLRKKIPSVHGRKRAAQAATLTPGGRVETSLADTKWKRNFFVADTGIGFWRVVGFILRAKTLSFPKPFDLSAPFVRHWLVGAVLVWAGLLGWGWAGLVCAGVGWAGLGLAAWLALGWLLRSLLKTMRL